MTAAVQSPQTMPVWDIFVRIFHWLLVAAIAFAWWSGEQGGEWMEWHMRAGYLVLGLVIFRLLWGFAGSFHARFSSFVRSPPETLRYTRSLLQRREPHYAGHNPLGGWAVLLLLLFCVLQAGSGLFANDDIMTEGPLASLVGYDLSIEITRWHKLLFNALLALVGLHLAGVIFHQIFRREKLVQAMFSGRKALTQAVDRAPAMAQKNLRWRGIFLVAIAGLLVWGLISL